MTAALHTTPALDQPAPPTKIRRLLASLLLLLLLAATLRYLHLYNLEHTLDHNDLIGRQFATRAALLHRADLYSPRMTRQIQDVAGHDPGQAFDYPALLAVLLVPVASLSWPTLRFAFLLLIVPALLVSFRLCVSLLRAQTSRVPATLIALLALLSWPVVYALRLQQPTLLVAIFILPVCWLLSRERDVPAGILLALSTFKPHLVLPLLLWLLLWTALRRRWTFAAAFAISECIYLLCAQLLFPGWFPHWLADLHRYRSLVTMLPLQLVLGRTAGLACTLLLAAWTLRRLWQLRHAPPRSTAFAQAIALVLATTVCIAPTTWAMVYNQILLVPAAILLFSTPLPSTSLTALAHRASQTFVLWAFASVPIAVLGQTLLPSSRLWICCPFLNYLLAPTLALAFLTRPLQHDETAAPLPSPLRDPTCVPTTG